MLQELSWDKNFISNLKGKEHSVCQRLNSHPHPAYLQQYPTSLEVTDPHNREEKNGKHTSRHTQWMWLQNIN